MGRTGFQQKMTIAVYICLFRFCRELHPKSAGESSVGLIHSFGEVCKPGDQVRTDGKPTPASRRSSLLRPLQKKFPCDECCSSLGSFCLGAVHERPHIPCANGYGGEQSDPKKGCSDTQKAAELHCCFGPVESDHMSWAACVGVRGYSSQKGLVEASTDKRPPIELMLPLPPYQQ
ncbi:hypothetical protein Bbelb_152530 [Branchiostoma belcheri]|nr:hypothetical protein Bbelb_152530 [Branchiostoma belcheri]